MTKTKIFTHLIFNKKNLTYLIPIVLVVFLSIHIIISYAFIHDGWFDKDISYAETGIIAFILSMCNCIPFWWRVKKLKNTKSFSSYTLGINSLNNVFSAVTFSSSFIYLLLNPQIGLTIMLIRWVPDVLGQFIHLYTSVYVFVFKMKNCQKFKDESMKITFTHKKTTFAAIFLCLLTAIGLIITIYFKVTKYRGGQTYSNPTGWTWVYVIAACHSCLSIITNVPFIVKLMYTRNTYSISMYSKVSLLSSMFAWIILDLQTVQIENVAAFLPLLVSDGFVVLWAAIPIVYKVCVLYKAKKYNLTELEYCTKIANAQAQR